MRRTPDGRRLLVSRLVDAPAERVWELLVETRHWSAWGPSVDDVEPADTRVRAGTTGRVRVAGVGVWIPFEVTSRSADELRGTYRWTWRVAGIPATGHRVESTGENRCRVGFEIPLLAAGYAAVCTVALRRIERLAVE
ncbi:polyketide cyclase [Haloprofundus marisrubri]|uniref:Polyketide cyclase n=2 Tax=Haloprofundus marisrubri TaxID=1514971 RepID=A0A0W1RBT5_9EURY|nr:SRPBCC family protein [Haloprofundus marisrubri]KTG10514.1 polyketide cyclase [Haloprofundus marisrubri]